MIFIIAVVALAMSALAENSANFDAYLKRHNPKQTSTRDEVKPTEKELKAKKYTPEQIREYLSLWDRHHSQLKEQARREKIPIKDRDPYFNYFEVEYLPKVDEFPRWYEHRKWMEGWRK